MGWLDKLLGRGGQDSDESAATPTVDESHEAPDMPDDVSHEGHDHAPGEPHDHSHE